MSNIITTHNKNKKLGDRQRLRKREGDNDNQMREIMTARVCLVDRISHGRIGT